MSFIGMFAKQKEAEQIKKEIEKETKEIKIEIIPINLKSIENIKNIKFDIVIMIDDLEKLKGKEKYIKEILRSSKYLILNSDINSDIKILKEVTAKTITYGLNQKATITVSSIGEEEIIICIQRAFKNIDDNIIEQKEVRRKIEKNNIKNIYNSLIKEAIINIYSAKNR